MDDKVVTLIGTGARDVLHDLQTWLLFQASPANKDPPQTLILPTPPQYVWHIGLAMYCLFVVSSLDGTASQTQHVEACIKSVASCCLAGFGGSFINAALLGISAPPITTQDYILTMVAAWVVFHNSAVGNAARRLFRLPGIQHIIKVGYEVFRCWVIFAWYKKSVSIVPEGALLGPLICGTLGGSGGALLPWDKGLKPLANGAPWNMESAFYLVATYHLLTLYSEYTVDDLLFVRTVLILAFVVARLLPADKGDRMFAPIRTVLRFMVALYPPTLSDESDGSGKHKAD